MRCASRPISSGQTWSLRYEATESSRPLSVASTIFTAPTLAAASTRGEARLGRRDHAMVPALCRAGGERVHDHDEGRAGLGEGGVWEKGGAGKGEGLGKARGWERGGGGRGAGLGKARGRGRRGAGGGEGGGEGGGAGKGGGREKGGVRPAGG